jgi:hypothetical protein
VDSAIAGQRADLPPGADSGTTPIAAISKVIKAERRTAAAIFLLRFANRTDAASSGGDCPSASDRSRSHADHFAGTHFAVLRHLRPRKPVGRSIPNRPTPMAGRPKFRKLRFQMIANMLTYPFVEAPHEVGHRNAHRPAYIGQLQKVEPTGTRFVLAYE